MNFVNKHPWLTFFLGIVALGTIGEILGPKPVQIAQGNLGPPTPPGYKVVYTGGRWMAIGLTGQTVGQPLLHWNGNQWLRS